MPAPNSLPLPRVTHPKPPGQTDRLPTLPGPWARTASVLSPKRSRSFMARPVETTSRTRRPLKAVQVRCKDAHPRAVPRVDNGIALKQVDDDRIGAAVG